MKMISIMLILILVFCSLVSAGTKIIDEYTTDTGNSINIYSYQKNYYDDNTGTWEEIDEDFYTGEDCISLSAVPYSYCQIKDNMYKSYLKSDLMNTDYIGIEKDGSVMTLDLADFWFKSQSIDMHTQKGYIDDNQVTYIIDDDISLRYSYLPDMFKEEIILDSYYIKDPSIKDKVFKASFNIKGYIEGYSIPEHFFIYDGLYNLIDIRPVDIEGSTVTLYMEWGHEYENITLPMIIDPQIILDNNSVEWDGSVYYQPTAGRPPTYYFRLNFPGSLNLGSNRVTVGFPPVTVENIRKSYRSSIRINISALVGLNLTSAGLHAYVTKSNNYIGVSTYINFSHMGKYEYDYPDNAELFNGNHYFWRDMGNGTLYNRTNITGIIGNIIVPFNKTSYFLDDVRSRLDDDKTDFMFGMTQEPISYPPSPPYLPNWNFTQIAGSKSIRPDYRYYVTFNYSIDDECQPPPIPIWRHNITCIYHDTILSYTGNISCQDEGRFVFHNTTLNLTRPFKLSRYTGCEIIMNSSRWLLI